jgi:hypothetical protein
LSSAFSVRNSFASPSLPTAPSSALICPSYALMQVSLSSSLDQAERFFRQGHLDWSRRSVMCPSESIYICGMCTDTETEKEGYREIETQRDRDREI